MTLALAVAAKSSSFATASWSDAPYAWRKVSQAYKNPVQAGFFIVW